MSAPRQTSALSFIPACLAGASAVALAVTLNQSAVHWRPNVVDDHLYAYSGWRLLHGARPYLEVWDNKPPGIWWLNAAAFGLFGEGVLPEIALCSATLVVTLLSFVAAARGMYGGGAWLPALLCGCVLLTHVRFECGGNRTETYLASCEAVAAACYLGWLRRRGHAPAESGQAWLFAAGLAAGAAPLFKQNGVAILAAICLHYFILVMLTQRRGTRAAATPARRGLAALLLGAATIPALTVAALASQGALAAAWSATFEFNRLFFRVGDASWTKLAPGFFRYLPEVLPLCELLTLAAAGPVVALALRAAAARRPTSPPASTHATESTACGVACAKSSQVGVGFAWLWLSIAFYLALVGSGRQAYHLAPCLTPLGLLTLHPLMSLLGGRPAAVTLARRAGSAALLMGYVGLLTPVLEDSLASARRCWQEKPAWWALHRVRPAEYEQQAAVIRAVTSPADEIYVWGWSPGTYRFAYRRCPSRHATLEHVSHVAPHAEFIVETAAREIVARPPRAFVISLDDLDGLAPSRPAFAEWLRENYALHDTVAGMHIFLRASDRSTPPAR